MTHIFTMLLALMMSISGQQGDLNTEKGKPGLEEQVAIMEEEVTPTPEVSPTPEVTVTPAPTETPEVSPTPTPTTIPDENDDDEEENDDDEDEDSEANTTKVDAYNSKSGKIMPAQVPMVAIEKSQALEPAPSAAPTSLKNEDK